MQGFNFLEILSTFVVLFAVIDIIGSIPIIIDVKKKVGRLNALNTSLTSLILLLVFLFVGKALLGLFGVDISSFAIAGSFVLFVLALEMIFGVTIFKYEQSGKATTLVPLAFPLIAGAGSFTTLLALRAEYELVNILIALVLNIIVVYIVLSATNLIERLVGEAGILILKKFFGVILLAISIRLFMSNFAKAMTELLPDVFAK